jgi:hypothetical protein
VPKVAISSDLGGICGVERGSVGGHVDAGIRA